MLIKVANKDTESVVSALIKQSQKLPGELYKSLTWDRGKELADHQRLAIAADVEIYFCDPRSPSAVQMRTPIDCCANTYRAPLTCPYIAKPSSMLTSGSSTNVQERPCFIRRPRKKFPNVLRRSIEPTAKSSRSENETRRRAHDSRALGVPAFILMIGFAEPPRCSRLSCPQGGCHDLAGALGRRPEAVASVRIESRSAREAPC